MNKPPAELTRRVQKVLEDHSLVGPADRKAAADKITALVFQDLMPEGNRRWEQFAEKAILTPFLDRGRNFLGWDCWGLVVSAYRDVLGVELPSYGECYAGVRDHKALVRLTTERDEWSRLIDPEHGSVALIYRRGLPIHVGIVIGRRILHCEEGVDTIVEPFERFRFEGFYGLQ